MFDFSNLTEYEAMLFDYELYEELTRCLVD